ncbi:MAG TPA: hypothetical protein PLR06_02300 [Cyclobacteriaceae bacterium]|nr:hypothetical protein [Cyclobacteriaceae bacterium]
MKERLSFRSLLADREPNSILIHYKTLRRWVGWLGILLPFVLWIGGKLIGDCSILQPSISHYYYTNMREVFVGVLCAVSLFLFTYKGPSRLDGILTNIAAFFSLGVALFPTDILESSACQHEVTSFIGVRYHAVIHLTCASLFFIILALMSLFLFTRTSPDPSRLTKNKLKRNVIYRICGVVMIVALIAILIYFLSGGRKENQVVFFMEAAMLVFFGISWLTKGEALFPDKPVGRSTDI